MAAGGLVVVVLEEEGRVPLALCTAPLPPPVPRLEDREGVILHGNLVPRPKGGGGGGGGGESWERG